MRIAYALLLALACTHVAHADEDSPLPAEGPRNAVTVSLVAPVARGVGFGYERAFVGSKLGLTTTLGMRFPENGDFRVRGYGLGLELRWYTLGRSAFRRLAERAMVGLFLYGRATWMLTTLRTDGPHQLVGRGHRLAGQVGLGYRFVMGPAIELTPSFGFEVRTDFASGIARGTRPSGAFGMTMGWMFDHGR